MMKASTILAENLSIQERRTRLNAIISQWKILLFGSYCGPAEREHYVGLFADIIITISTIVKLWAIERPLVCILAGTVTCDKDGCRLRGE